MTSSNEQLVPVEQVDCDAAAELIEQYWKGSEAIMESLARSYRSGHKQGLFARLFAKHRLAALRTPPAAQQGLAPPFEFDRYINGKLMAEGVTIERAASLDVAMLKAAQIASRGPNGEVPVLVCRTPPAVEPDEGLVEPVAWLYDGPDGEHYIREHRDVSYNWLVRNGWTETPLHAITTPIRAPQVEPVAWMYYHPDRECGGTEIWPERHEYGESWTETPLYEHPPSIRAQALEEAAKVGKLLKAINDEATRANGTIALKRDGEGQGRITVATAMHRIGEWSADAIRALKGGQGV